ncbi:MAG: sodium-dependent transporter [Gammaproteobacteria bacterium]|nr:sodium-dependent transporter [Gammaproteobacteria bacterium]
MAENQNQSQHGMWSSGALFVLAAVGSAVGLGNIWKFPYITGENGGGAFLLVYLICICLIGFPVMMAEIMLGREGRMSPINSVLKLARENNRSPNWSLIGWAGTIGGIIILSFYAVIAGWITYYVWRLFSGEFVGQDAEAIGSAFGSFLASPWQVFLWFTLFMAVTIYVVARGVNKGLELAIRICMPLIFVLLIVLLIYGIAQGGFWEGFKFMFQVDFSKLKLNSLLVAMGHAFFTLSIGMGAIMAYGAYMPQAQSVKSAVGIIVIVDTVVALVAGLAIFSIVFADGLAPDQSVGLLFATAPVAFADLPFGSIFGGLFFLFVAFAAFTSAISLTEPALAYFVERYNVSRVKVAVSIGAITWVLGLGSVLSFNLLSGFKPLFGWTIFDFLDKITTWFFLPLGGLAIVVFVGYFLPRKKVWSVLEINTTWARNTWAALICVVGPIAIGLVFVLTIVEHIPALHFLIPFLVSNG